LSIGSPVIAELAAVSGFDWLLFDLEHGAASDAALMGSLQAIRGTSAKAIVRVGALHTDLIMRALDWGSSGIMMPHVESAVQAQRCLQAIHYAPRGRRGFSRSVRAYDYGLKSPADVPAPLFFAQIESINGVEEAGRIASTEGVDILFVGPSDLAHDISVSGNGETPSYEECLKRVVTAARNAGKASGILVRNMAEVPILTAMGFTHVAIESDLGILRSGYKALLQRTRADSSSEASADSTDSRPTV
jgi:2-dehydro-3-deoxyglucarate aldolase/4-hydroxy-2-oxoheptanedioate aldolase